MIRSTELLHDQALLDLMPTAVYVIDADGVIRSFNQKACEIWGRTPRPRDTDEKWCGGFKLFLPCRTLMPHDQTPMVAAVRDGVVTKNAEVIIQQEDGTETVVMVNISPLRDETGKIVGAINAFQDVTELVETRKALMKKQHELEKAVAARDAFLSVCSHELKTPLTNLKFQSQMAKRKLAKNDFSVFDPEAVEKMIDQNDRQYDRLNRLVDDMLDLSRGGLGKLLIAPEEVELVALFEQVIARQDLNGVPVRISANEQVIGMFDRFKLEKVATHLLANAVKYGLDKPVDIKIERIGSNARFEIHDEGMGIAWVDQARVFGRFERAVSEKNISGFGLGLYVSKQIVEAHQGKISISSSLGCGSTFMVDLPLGLNERFSKVD